MIILDNVDDMNFLKPSSGNSHATTTTTATTEPQKQLESYIPYCDHGSVLITSRDMITAEELVGRANIILVKPMDEADALTLLWNKLGQSDDEAYAAELVEELDFMPLAIAQAAAYILRRLPRCSLQEYLDELRNSSREKARLLGLEDGRLRQDVKPNLIGLTGKDYRRDAENNNSILFTWQMSFDYIRKTRSSAADLLSLMSFCDRQGIPEFLLRHKDNDIRCDDEQNRRDNESFENDIATLQNFLFITTDGCGTSFEMHRLVQLATREWLRSQYCYELWQQRFIVKLNVEFPEPTSEHLETREHLARCQALFPHALLISAERPKGKESLAEWADVLLSAAYYAVTMEKTVEVEKLCFQIADADEEICDKTSPMFAQSKMLRAWAHTLGGDPSKKEESTVEFVEVLKESLGENHVQTLKAMSRLASVYSGSGQLQAAERLHVQVIEGFKKQLGEGDLATLIQMTTLATMYNQAGRWREAEVLLLQVTETFGKQPKSMSDNPERFRLMCQLAEVYMRTSRLQAAEELLVQVMKASSEQRKTGASHRYGVSSMISLADLYMRTERWQAAEGLLVQAIEAQKKWLEADDFNTLASMAGLAEIYAHTDRWQAAEGLLVAIIEAQRGKLRENHPLVLDSMTALASMRWKFGRFGEAKALLRHCVKLWEGKVGVHHPIYLAKAELLAEWEKYS